MRESALDGRPLAARKERVSRFRRRIRSRYRAGGKHYYDAIWHHDINRLGRSAGWNLGLRWSWICRSNLWARTSKSIAIRFLGSSRPRRCFISQAAFGLLGDCGRGTKGFGVQAVSRGRKPGTYQVFGCFGLFYFRRALTSSEIEH